MEKRLLYYERYVETKFRLNDTARINVAYFVCKDVKNGETVTLGHTLYPEVVSKFLAIAERYYDDIDKISNNYDIFWKTTNRSAVGAGIFNGDVGTIQSIDTGSETLTVLFDDRVAEYDFTQLNELEPAYAMTVHKSQGSEYRAVVLAAWNGSPYLLSRSILYTAITRARELLVIVGREETVGVMVENAKKNRRYSGLKLRLQGKVG